jgi:Ni/Co efflux regulator RcnB
MIHTICAGLLALFLAGAAFAESQAILQIRKEFQAIQRLQPQLKKVTVKLEDLSTEGGDAQSFRDSKGEVRVIQTRLYFESGKVLADFYYRNGALIFAHYRNHSYNVPHFVTPELAKANGGEPFDPRKTKISEDRYYFAQGQMIRWLGKNGMSIGLQSPAFADAEKEVAKFSSDVFAKFK